MTLLTRGTLAKRCGINRETVRYYERSGLLPEPARSEGNYCLFDDEAVERLNFIRRAQTAGFSLDEIRSLLSLKFDPVSTCGDVSEMVQAKVVGIDQKIQALVVMRESLVELLHDCPGGDVPIEECPILENFSSVEVKIHHSV